MLVKRSSAVVSVPLALMLTAFYVSSSYVNTGIDGYWETVSIRATSALLLIAPITSAASAWEVVRLRRGGALSYPGVRSRIRIVFRSLVPVLFGSVICLAAGWVLLGSELRDSGGAPDYRIFLMGVAVLVGWSSIGAIAGLLLPFVIAAPACLITGYVALAYPPSMNPIWARHLTGVNSSCCLNTDRVATAAIAAPGVLAGGALAAATALLVLRSRLVASASALCAMVVALQVGVHLVRPFGPDPVDARPATELVCVSGAVKVCVWPEHKSQLPVAEDAANRIRQVASAAIDVPELASEGTAAWQFGLNQDSSPAGVLESLVIGLFPQEPPAACEGRPWLSGPAVPLLEAWTEARVGVSDDELTGLHSPELLTTLAGIRRMTAPRQFTLMRRLQTAALRCSALPVHPGPR